MNDIIRTIEKDGENIAWRLLPEFRDRAAREAKNRAKEYGAHDGELRATGSYLGTVAVLHFLRLPPGERAAIYAEMRAVMDARCRVGEDAPLELAPYGAGRDELGRGGGADGDGMTAVDSEGDIARAVVPERRRARRGAGRR